MDFAVYADTYHPAKCFFFCLFCFVLLLFVFVVVVVVVAFIVLDQIVVISVSNPFFAHFYLEFIYFLYNLQIFIIFKRNKYQL